MLPCFCPSQDIDVDCIWVPYKTVVIMMTVLSSLFCSFIVSNNSINAAVNVIGLDRGGLLGLFPMRPASLYTVIRSSRRGYQKFHTTKWTLPDAWCVTTIDSAPTFVCIFITYLVRYMVLKSLVARMGRVACKTLGRNTPWQDDSGDSWGCRGRTFPSIL